MGVSGSHPAPAGYASEQWRTLETVMSGLMSTWRFILLAAGLAVTLLEPASTVTNRMGMQTWLVVFAVYALLALWLSVAFPRTYNASWMRIARIHLDLAAIFAIMVLDPYAHGFLWVFFSMRLLAAFWYFDGIEWVWVYLLSCLAIMVATLVRSGFIFGPLSGTAVATMIAKGAVLGVITWCFLYVLRLIPRLSNAGYLSKTSLHLMGSLDQGQIAHLIARAAQSGIPASDSVVVHLISGKEDPTLIPTSSTQLDVTTLGRTPMKLGQGVAGWALQHRKTVYVPDVNQDGRWMPLEPGGQKIVSLLVAPLYIGQRNLGTISVNSGRRRAFNEQDAQYLETVAAQASLALANAELFEKRSKHRAQLGEILTASLSFDPCQPLDALLSQLAEAVRKHSGYQMAAVNFIEPMTNTLVVRAMAGIPPAGREHLAQQRLPMQDLLPYLNDSFRISQSYYIRHDRKPLGSRVDAYAWTPDLGERGPGEWHPNDTLLVPIMEQTGQVLGYLSVDDPVDRQMPSFENVQMLEVLARLIGSMVHTAQLFGEREQQRDRAHRHAQLHRLLHTISTVTPSLDSLERMLHVYLTGITSNDGLGYNRVCLLQLEGGGSCLSVKMAIGQLEPQMARRIWEGMVAGHQTIDDYLLSVQAGAQFEPTELDERLRGQRFAVSPDGSDAFSKVLRERQLLFVYPGSEPRLPVRFAELAEVTTCAVVIPLIVGTQILGVLVCDNKITDAPLANLDLLANFASHIAAVMEDDRLRRQAHSQATTSGWREGMQYERFRLQDGIHDALNWLLTGVKWEAELVEAHLDSGDLARAEEATARLLTKVDRACTLFEGILDELRRPFLAELGILTALEQRAPVLQTGQVRISGVIAGPLPPRIENELLRVGIEAMANAAKHSGARTDPDTRVVVNLQMRGNQVELSIADNGIGFEPAEVFASGGDHGLCRMQQRVREAGGALEVMSKAGVGTEVRATFPLGLEA